LNLFEDFIVWKKVAGSNDEIPEPKPGKDPNFDQANERVNKVKDKLLEVLN
jgi:hypothetical protein